MLAWVGERDHGVCATGEAKQPTLRRVLDRRIKLEFHGRCRVKEAAGEEYDLLARLFGFVPTVRIGTRRTSLAVSMGGGFVRSTLAINLESGEPVLEMSEQVQGQSRDGRGRVQSVDDGVEAIGLPLYGFCAALLAIAIVLVALYVVSLLLPGGAADGGAAPALHAFRELFDLNGEANLPAWYTGLLWLFAALSALGVAVQVRLRRERHAGYWQSLSILFLFMSLDESAQLHERIGAILEGWMLFSGFLYYVWVIYGMTLVGFLIIVYSRFLLSLPAEVKFTIIVSAVVFLSGALGLEMLGAAVDSGEVEFPAGLNWVRAVILEEFLEMTGIILLIYGLMRFMSKNRFPLHFVVVGSRAQEGRG